MVGRFDGNHPAGFNVGLRTLRSGEGAGPKQQGGKVITPTGGYTLGTNEIVVSMRHVGLFQTGDDLRKAKNGQVHLVAVTLMHELVHWAREKAGLGDDPDVEVGFEFEKQVYGWVIDR